MMGLQGRHFKDSCLSNKHTADAGDKKSQAQGHTPAHAVLEILADFYT